MNLDDIKEHISAVNDDNKFCEFTENVKKFIENSITYMFPGYFSSLSEKKIDKNLINEILSKVLMYYLDDCSAKKIAEEIICLYPKIYNNIISDIDAAYRGDPATQNYDEIILTYPCFRAISAYRIAHEIYLKKVPLLARAITEYEHRLTGIDIHPGAAIGNNFFIDHGTGVVIGETCVIGDNVTLYQNVTLGAKSFPHDDEGNLVKGIKRHPNLENNVIVYAGATILGDITIGENSVIGGNVWLTKSVPANQTVTR